MDSFLNRGPIQVGEEGSLWGGGAAGVVDIVDAKAVRGNGGWVKLLL